ncbi:hypothetical protein RF11_15933 [Thelohanellus kitauei]|uniref:Uncharacterized protein n=1 Tax=Thelohanellus kitauei TaxID=669202 RepID=A0A0C2IM21_THEKT|nr:hypothetical protein RF11_15933 [Thelohanellus kitauei]
MIFFVFIGVLKIITFEDSNKICYAEQIRLGSVDVDPQEGDLELGHMGWLIDSRIHSFSADLHWRLEILKKYFNGFESFRVFDTKTCKLRPDNDFFQLDVFLYYLKPRVADM